MAIPFIQKVERYGKIVWENTTADEIRKTGCLCINGCKRFANNQKWQEENKQRLGEAYQLNQFVRDAACEFFCLNDDEQRKQLDAMTEDSLCPIATMNFAVCLAGGIANAVTRCKWFVPDPTVFELYYYTYTIVSASKERKECREEIFLPRGKENVKEEFLTAMGNNRKEAATQIENEFLESEKENRRRKTALSHILFGKGIDM